MAILRQRYAASPPGGDPRSRDTSPAPSIDTSLDSADTAPGSEKPFRLLWSHEVPDWYSQNDSLLTGYRPVRRSVPFCLASLGYLHNESVNIYSHLIPAITALVGNWALYVWFDVRFPLATPLDRFVFHLNLTTSVVCFAVSAAYHTMLCHSAFYYDLWTRIDYVAILVQILGSFVSGIYVSFYCEPVLQRIYWTMIVTLASFTCIVVLHPRLQTKKWKYVRLAAFVATGLSGFAPVIHGICIVPYEELKKRSGLHYYLLEGFLLLVGVGFFGTQFPECWKPTQFDIFGASHQIFHVLVVLSAAAHLYGVLDAYAWTYDHPRC